MTPHDPLVLAAAFALAVIATARFTRLAIYDAWPPVRAVRRAYLARTDEDGWQPLLTCPFCLAPWPAAANLTWAILSGLNWHHPWGAAWWIANAWFAGAYLASMLVVRDEPEPVED